MTQHKYNTMQHETTQVQHKTTRVQHETTRVQQETTRVQHETTRVQNNLISNINLISCRSSRSQMFLKIDILKTFASFTRKHLSWSLFLIKLQATFFRTLSFTEHLQQLLLWFLQQNNLIFSIIMITLGHNQKLP